MEEKKILFLSHDASRTGAPILLLNFLKVYKSRNPTTIFDFIIGCDGPLRGEFESLGKVFVLERKKHAPKSLINRGLVFLRKRFLNSKNEAAKEFSQKIRNFVSKDYDLVFSNTITNGEILKALNPVDCNIITYVHELENAIKIFTTPTTLHNALKYTDHFLIPSEAVRENLKKNHGIQPSLLEKLHYYIPEYHPTEHQKLMTHSKTGASDSDFIIGTIGTFDWRKGADLFLQVAYLLRKRRPDVRWKFMWVGISGQNELVNVAKHDIELTGLEDVVFFVESVANPLDYLSLMDVFLLPSREDPYPLVALEAAMLGKPVVCFEKSGGATEFLSGGNGVIVPYFDIEAMAEKMIKLFDDEEERKKYGEAARKEYIKLHSEESAGKAFESVIKKYSERKKNGKYKTSVASDSVGVKLGL